MSSSPFAVVARAGAMLAVVSLMGCGFGRSKFDEEFSITYCDKAIECTSEPELTFAGIEKVEDCIDHPLYRVGDSVTSLGTEGDCDFKRRKAKKCVQALEEVTCSDDALFPGFELPAECSEIFKGDGCVSDPAEASEPVLGDTDTD